MKLESDNDNYYYFIGELLSKNWNSRAIAVESLASNDDDCISMFNDDNSTKDFKNRCLIDEREEHAESFSNLRKGF